MFDPFGSMGNFVSQFRGFISNPVQFIMQRNQLGLREMNFPQDIARNPKGAVEQLMNSGKMSQQQFNQLQQMAKQIQANPQFMQMFGGK